MTDDISPYEIPHIAYDKHFTPPDDKLLEEIAKELYFEGKDYEEGSVAMLTWNEGWPARKEKWLLRAGRILAKVQEHYKIEGGRE